MKGAKFAVVLLAATFATVAVAQIHGTPPSVTSIRIGGEAHGVPASVTSLGPNGFQGGRHGGTFFPCAAGPLIPSAMGCINPLFNPSVNSITGQVQFGDVNVRGGRRRPRGWSTPVYYPYPVYTYPVYDTTDYTEPVAPPVAPPVQPVQIQIQVEDKRTPVPQPEAAAEAPAPRQQSSEPVQQGPPTILVFRDGHQQEVQNYAIVGKTLYDLGTFVAHKIPLADLDLPQTIKVNEDRGVDFTLPNGYKMD